MKRTFRHVDVNLVPQTPPKNGGGGSKPKPGQGDSPSDIMQKLSDMMVQKEAQTPPEEERKANNQQSETNEDRSSLSYKEIKEKLRKEVIAQMLEKLVIEQAKERKVGTDFLDKRSISRDVCVDAEYKIPNELYAIRKKPMHFYFDFSGSCESLSGMFAQITAGLIEKGAITYIGENGDINFRIDKAPKTIDADAIQALFNDDVDHRINGYEITYFKNVPLKEAIKRDRVERLICYTDYDSALEMVEASEIAELIWFSAQGISRNFSRRGKTLADFKGKFYQARNIQEIKTNLMNLNNPAFEKQCRTKQIGRMKK